MLGESGERRRHRAAARLLARGGRAAGAAARRRRGGHRGRGAGRPPRRPPRRGRGRAGADRGDARARARAAAEEPLGDDERAEIEAQARARSARRREQLGPVNPLAEREYEQALAHVESLETQRTDLETALAELQGLIRETDRKIHAAFEETFEATQRNFEELVEHLFPGGRGRLRLVDDRRGPKPVLGGAERRRAGDGRRRRRAEDAEEADGGWATSSPRQGVEIEVTPAGKATRRLSLLSGGEKALVALAFVFAVFLARPSPFYILDEVEAALDDANIDRFLQLVSRFSDRAQFIIVTHQKRTMDAADVLYGVSMGKGGVTKVVSRRFEAEQPALGEASAKPPEYACPLRDGVGGADPERGRAAARAPSRAGARRAASRACASGSSKSRQALRAELSASLFDKLDDETWERLEEALILADVGAKATAEVVGRLEAEVEAGEVERPRGDPERLVELLAELAGARAADARPERRSRR